MEILTLLPPHIFLCGTLIWFLLMLNQDTRAEGRGRVARIQRRLLVVEVEKWIMQYQTCMNQGKVKHQILCLNLKNVLNSSLHNVFWSVRKQSYWTNAEISLIFKTLMLYTCIWPLGSFKKIRIIHCFQTSFLIKRLINPGHLLLVYQLVKLISVVNPEWA